MKLAKVIPLLLPGGVCPTCELFGKGSCSLHQPKKEKPNGQT
jgi:hypothetical protein